MGKPLLLYSVNSKLAHFINTEYYHSHYVWCTTKYNTSDLGALIGNPGTSNPAEIIRLYWRDLDNIQKDNHYSPAFLIERITGITRGIEYNKELIGEKNYKELRDAINQQQENGQIWKELHPVLYIIPFSLVEKRLIKVPPAQKASFSSEEYIIPDLHDNEFDTIVDIEVKI